MSTLIVGDLHLKAALMLPRVDAIISNRTVRRVVFTGDVVNDWESTAMSEYEDVKNIADWTSARRRDGIDVNMIVGNHEAWYLLDQDDHSPGAMAVRSGSPGHHRRGRGDVGSLRRDQAPPPLLLADDATGARWVITHAGITAGWARMVCLPLGDYMGMVDALDSMLNNGDWGHLYMCGRARGGDDANPSPLWADMTELLSDPAPHLNQIVGHTPVRTVTGRTTPDGSRIVLVDTMSTTSTGESIGDGSMLLLTDDPKDPLEVIESSITGGHDR